MSRQAVAAPGDVLAAARGVASVIRLVDDRAEADRLTYLAVYACGFSGRTTDLGRFQALGAVRHEAFLARLGAEVTDAVEVTGWEVVDSDDERVFITRDGMRAYVGRNELTGVWAPGERVRFAAPAVRAGLMPGFVVRLGASPLVDRTRLTRFYLNIAPAAAAWALGALSRRLDAGGLAYEIKVLAHPRAYIRRDTCVLYVRSDDEAPAAAIVTGELARLDRRWIRRGAPRLTGRIAPGVNMAHEPSDISPEGLSHGQWVTGLLHEAADRSTEPREIAAHVRDLIAQAGRDPRAPHLRGT